MTPGSRPSPAPRRRRFSHNARFSRQNEQEADRIGILNLEKAGYDPRSMPTMFERLMRQYRFDAKPPEFLLTHPVTESRIADTRNRAEQAKPGGIEDIHALSTDPRARATDLRRNPGPGRQALPCTTG